MTPEARKDQVLAEDVGDEVVVYDERTSVVHRLNPTAALVWRLANGRRSVGELATRVHETLDVPEDEDFVRLALAELDQAGLLAQVLPGAGELISRRHLFKVAAALLPVVASVVAPTPAMAATPPSPPPTPTVDCSSVSGHYAATGSLGSGCSGLQTPSGSIVFECNNSNGTFTLTLWDDPNGRVAVVYTGTLGSGNTFSGTGPGGSSVSGSFQGDTMTLNETTGGCAFNWSATKDN